MLDRLNNYIDDKKFKLIYEDNLIDIINYTRLITIENNYVSLYINNKKIIIKGKELILKKLLDNELLLNGEVTSLEVVND
ncbi:MAG: YabP/YqfC family sporulation protein [Mollicutes bacterium]|nr:YabP/YqfC family sporulation protein [Mollicutes bacterium]MDY5875333.1 YabP/YqfC family sporulation protein [Bacilli bacterium]